METRPTFRLYFGSQTYNTNTRRAAAPFRATRRHLLLIYILQCVVFFSRHVRGRAEAESPPRGPESENYP